METPDISKIISEVFNNEDRVLSLPVEELETSSRVVHRATKGYATILSSQNPDWGHATLQIRKAWGFNRGAGVRVAVLDTGISQSHEDLEVVDGVDFTLSPFSWQDVQSHGSHCAGIIGARDNGVGVVGVAPECELLAVKVLGDNGSGSIGAIANGIAWAVQKQADVISMSLGGDGPINGRLKYEIDKAIAAGVLVIVAAGNSGPYPGTIGAPGVYTPCVTVGAIDSQMKVARFSSRGPQIDICAPGVDIVSCVPGSRYTAMSGTSMATPYVAGVAALYVALCKKYGVDPSQSVFESVAKKTAVDIDASGFDNNSGFGVISPVAILKATQSMYAPPLPPPPAPEPTPEPAPAPEPTPEPEDPDERPTPEPPRDIKKFNLVFEGVRIVPVFD